MLDNTVNNYVKLYLCNILKKYFLKDGILENLEFIGSVSKIDSELLIRFLLCKFKNQDTMFKILYEKYLEYMKKEGCSPLEKNTFERCLFELGFDVDVFIDES